MEDQRIGSALRHLRVRRRWRQVDAVAVARISRSAAMQIEAGRLDEIRVGEVRRYAAALGARFEGLIRWHGADLDRMLNRGHARLHDATIRWLASVGGWLIVPEVSFAYRSDRGVIDVVAWHAATRSLLVIELKTRIADISDLMASMDIRRRVAPWIAHERGWDPCTVSMWVIVAPCRTNARILAEHATVLRAKFPSDGRTMRRWLREPAEAVAALSFMPQVWLGDLRLDVTTPRRVRRPSSCSAPARTVGPRRQMPRIGVTFHD